MAEDMSFFFFDSTAEAFASFLYFFGFSGDRVATSLPLVAGEG